MLKSSVLLSILLALTSCGFETRTEIEVKEQQRVVGQLEPECIFRDLGPYMTIQHLIMIRCRDDEHTTIHVQAGKTNRVASVTTLGQ